MKGMKKSKYTKERIIGFIKQAGAGIPLVGNEIADVTESQRSSNRWCAQVAHRFVIKECVIDHAPKVGAFEIAGGEVFLHREGAHAHYRVYVAGIQLMQPQVRRAHPALSHEVAVIAENRSVGA